MARRTTVTSKTTTTRGPTATSVRTTETVAAAPGAGLGEVLAILSTVLLLAAILMTDYYMGHKLGKSVFFGP
jgi:hypothetical protein